MGKLTWVHILTLFVGFIFDTDKVNGSTVNYEGFCVMPCRYQSKTYQSALDSTSPARWTVGSDDPSILAFRNNGTHISNQCMWRSGPFFVYRIERDGNTTHAWYYCSKHIPNDDNGDVITVYGNPMKQFPNYPTMCDVCTGNMKLLSVFKDETAGMYIMY
ncbi:uncharacterized protein [Mytilus edulis]|uniref:uncharacterized protein n=1 Tax=Mytilus edulis TaxID=6550 RepID=UPI0039F0770D